MKPARGIGAADLAAGGGAHGDVLQVRIGGGEAAGGGDKLMEMGVDAAGGGLDVLRQGIDVGGLQLGDLAVFEDGIDDGMAARKRGEGLFVGLVLAGAGLLRFVDELEFIEEDLAELFR